MALLEQESFINKPCVSEKACEHDKQMVLDRIRADINKQYKWLVNTRYTIRDIDIAFWHILQTIDKYKTESEEE